MYDNSVTLIGFVGADPVQREVRSTGSKFAVLSVATQRSYKNRQDEWVSKVEWHRVSVFRPLLAERVLSTIRKGSHVLVEGSLVSSTYEPNGNANGNGKSKSKKANAKSAKLTSWSIRADVVRRLDHGRPEPQAETLASASSQPASDADESIPF
jgi:single-strand DNA-binding protein